MTIRGRLASSYHARARNRALLSAVLFLACAALLGPVNAGDWRADIKHRDPNTRLKAAVALGRSADPAGLVALEAGLADSDKKVRYAAIRSLGLRRSGGAVRRLKAMAASADAGERSLAREALGRIGGPEAVADLALATTAREADAAEACRALQWSEDEISLASLQKAVQRPEPGVQAAALFALARRGQQVGAQAVPLLSAADPAVRIEAAQAIAVAGGAQAGGRLRTALAGEKDVLVRQVLEGGLRKLGGAP
ncbi:MAG: HEAT repeat domain-containing protein [Elusimicrobiota bacterium]